MVTKKGNPVVSRLDPLIGRMRDAGIVEGIYRKLEGPFAGLKEQVRKSAASKESILGNQKSDFEIHCDKKIIFIFAKKPKC